MKRGSRIASSIAGVAFLFSAPTEASERSGGTIVDVYCIDRPATAAKSALIIKEVTRPMPAPMTIDLLAGRFGPIQTDKLTLTASPGTAPAIRWSLATGIWTQLPASNGSTIWGRREATAWQKP
jgi:hypothetical protein